MQQPLSKRHPWDTLATPSRHLGSNALNNPNLTKWLQTDRQTHTHMNLATSSLLELLIAAKNFWGILKIRLEIRFNTLYSLSLFSLIHLYVYILFSQIPNWALPGIIKIKFLLPSDQVLNSHVNPQLISTLINKAKENKWLISCYHET